MYKTAFLITTLLMSFLTASSQDFNVSLSFPSHLTFEMSTQEGNHDAASGHKANDLGLNNLPIEADLIKEEFPYHHIQIQDFNTSSTTSQYSGVKTIVIDAGHGGHDPGCLGKKSHEKNIALSLAKKLATSIRKAHPDVKVILTRDKDVFIPLHKRAAIANRNNADLFISIHCNAMPAGHSKTHGTETYVMGLHTAQHNLDVAKRENASILLEADYEKNYDYDPNSPEGHIMLSMFQNAYLDQSILFANLVEHHFKVSSHRKSRGVKQAGFVVLKETTMPSVLIEAGFLSNAKEENFLYTKAGQDQIVKAILAAFTNYKKEVEGEAFEQDDYDFSDATVAKSADPSSSNEVYYTINEPRSYEYNPPVVQYEKNTPSTKTKEIDPKDMFKSEQKSSNGYKTYPGLDYPTKSVPDYRQPETTTTPKAVLTTQKKAPLKKVNLRNGPIQFKVQIAASPYPLDTTTPKWQQLGYMVEIVTENNLYKYQARNFNNYHHALEAKINLRQRGFSDAFIVAYQKGQRIKLEDAKGQLGLD